MNNGFHHDIPEDVYHDGKGVGAPALSQSIAKVLLASSPFHAQAARSAPREDKEAFDLGHAVHALVLEGEERFVIIDAPDWRKADAKEARDEARRNGKYPLLAHKAAAVRRMAKAIRVACDGFEGTPKPLTNGKPEVTMKWTEDGVTFLGRLDWLHADGRCIDDLKSTTFAKPDAWTRRVLYPMGYDLQHAFYRRGVKALTGKEPEFRFVVSELEFPHATSFVTLDSVAAQLADEKLEWIIGKWRECLRTGKWPSYPTRLVTVAPPPWELAASEQRSWDHENPDLVDDEPEEA